MRARGLRETVKLLPLEEMIGIRVCDAAGLLRAPSPLAVSLTCVHRAELLEVVLPAGADPGVRAEPTAYPLIMSESNRVDVSSSQDLRLPPGSYLALLKAPGCVDLRRPFMATRGDRTNLPTSLIPIQEAPPGDFVCIDMGPFVYQRDPEVSHPLWPDTEPAEKQYFISRHETTMGEWWEFLEDPSIQPTVRQTAENQGSLVPRFPGGSYWGEQVSRLSTQPWAVPDQAALDSPVVGLTADAIHAFIDWKNGKALAEGVPWVYELPSQQQWEKASRGVDGRTFVWGNRFDFSLCNSLFAYPPEQGEVLWLEPVGRFPTDESPFGVLDLAGGAVELNAGVLTPGKTEEVWRGGSWTCGIPMYFRAASRVAPRDDMPNRGFRLVAKRMGTQGR
jgi:formylglycine-generating enzyme required for sulfatase activity